MLVAVREMLMETEANEKMRATFNILETFNKANFKKKCRRCQRVLDEVNSDFQREVGELNWPSTVKEIAISEQLIFVCSILESSLGEAEEGNNPLTVEMVAAKKMKEKKGSQSKEKKTANSSKSVPPPRRKSHIHGKKSGTAMQDYTSSRTGESCH